MDDGMAVRTGPNTDDSDPRNEGGRGVEFRGARDSFERGRHASDPPEADARPTHPAQLHYSKRAQGCEENGTKRVSDGELAAMHQDGMRTLSSPGFGSLS